MANFIRGEMPGAEIVALVDDVPAQAELTGLLRPGRAVLNNVERCLDEAQPEALAVYTPEHLPRAGRHRRPEARRERVLREAHVHHAGGLRPHDRRGEGVQGGVLHGPQHADEPVLQGRPRGARWRRGGGACSRWRPASTTTAGGHSAGVEAPAERRRGAVDHQQRARFRHDVLAGWRRAGQRLRRRRAESIPAQARRGRAMPRLRPAVGVRRLHPADQPDGRRRTEPQAGPFLGPVAAARGGGGLPAGRRVPVPFGHRDAGVRRGGGAVCRRGLRGPHAERGQQPAGQRPLADGPVPRGPSRATRRPTRSA